jgi:hypothetical protein
MSRGNRHSGLATVAALALLSTVCGAQQLGCTDADVRRALEQTEGLRTWDALYRSYKLYGWRCDDGVVGEGYSEAVAHILVDHWDTLPRLAKLASRDRRFLRFVIGGVNATLDTADVEQIRRKARGICPGRMRPLCAALVKQADVTAAEQAEGLR